jgi:hypothetical protein
MELAVTADEGAEIDVSGTAALSVTLSPKL